MIEIIKAVPNTFIPLFVAIDVFAVLPIFISLTEGMPESKRQATIRESILTAVIVSFLFIAAGKAIFQTLRITADDFKIAGGLVLLIFAILELIKHGDEQRKHTDKMGVVPIGVPLIVGPAVLTTILVLVDHYGVIPTIISLMLNFLIVWVSFVYARRIIDFFGKGGIVAISKIMALLLASIAIMMIRIGIENTIKRLL